MGQDLGIVSCERVCLMWQRLHMTLQSMKPRALNVGWCMLCACVEGILCVVVGGGGCRRLDGLECTMEGMAGADEMCMVHVQG